MCCLKIYFLPITDMLAFKLIPKTSTHVPKCAEILTGLGGLLWSVPSEKPAKPGSNRIEPTLPYQLEQGIKTHLGMRMQNLKIPERRDNQKRVKMTVPTEIFFSWQAGTLKVTNTIPVMIRILLQLPTTSALHFRNEFCWTVETGLIEYFPYLEVERM